LGVRSDAFHYHGSGYVALGPAKQESDLIEVFERQQRIGYPSELHVGEAEVEATCARCSPTGGPRA
jgi:hypothetical protein